MKKKDLKSRIKYCFDNWMSKGTAAMVVMLTSVVLIFAIVISYIGIVFGANEEGFFAVLWNVIVTTINAWMPDAVTIETVAESAETAAEAAETVTESVNIAYTALLSISAIVGLFFTSFLIGIISSAVEDKLSQLRAGNSKVMEDGHIVILGFKPGEYTLISQMVLSADDNKCKIVIAEDMEKEKMEDLISENVDFPKNVKIICRNSDITDPVALESVSLETASLIIVNPIDDMRSVKALLAVSTYFEDREDMKPRVITSVDQDQYMIPYTLRQKYGFEMLRTNDAVARVISHSCTQIGLSQAFTEVFDFDGNELRLEKVDFKEGDFFKDILYSMDKAVPLGIIRKGTTLLNPNRNMPLEEGDRFIVLEENRGDFEISETRYIELNEEDAEYSKKAPADSKILIIGSNNKLKVIVNNLPSYAHEVVLAGIVHLEEKMAMCKKIREDINYSVVGEDVMDTTVLEKLVEGIDHVILLSDYELEEEAADARNIMLLFNLRDIRERKGARFTITSEMRRDDNRNLINNGDSTEFIVSSNMASMVLAQVATNDKLYDTFHELLSNEGNEFQVKEASFIENCIGVERNTAEIRRELVHKKCIFLGYIIEGEEGRSTTSLNPSLSRNIVLKPQDKLIVIGA